MKCREGSEEFVVGGDWVDSCLSEEIEMPGDYLVDFRVSFELWRGGEDVRRSL